MNFQEIIKFVIVPVRLILGKIGVDEFTSHVGKVTLDREMIFIFHQRHKDGNRIYCNHFSVIFEITGKFLIAFVKLILGKKGVDGVTGPRRKNDIRYEFNLKVSLKDLGWK